MAEKKKKLKKEKVKSLHGEEKKKHKSIEVD